MKGGSMGNRMGGQHALMGFGMHGMHGGWECLSPVWPCLYISRGTVHCNLNDRRGLMLQVELVLGQPASGRRVAVAHGLDVLSLSGKDVDAAKTRGHQHDETRNEIKSSSPFGDQPDMSCRKR